MWTVQVRDGIAWVRPPDWVDPHRRWTRNVLHQSHRHAQRLGQQLRLALEAGHCDQLEDTG
jgi:hypothetical protein